MISNFDFSRVGKEIKRLRITLGLSQKDLFEGILTQGTISKIENGEAQNIRVISLFAIAERLGVDPNYFYKIATIDSFAYVEGVTKKIDRYRKRDDFKEVYKIVKAEKNNKYLQSPILKQFMLWNEAICIFHEDKDYFNSIEKLRAALQITFRPENNYSEREIEILSSIAGIQMDYGYGEKAIKKYELCLNQLNKIDFLQNIQIKTKIYSNIAKWKANHQQNYDSINYCNLGIEWCQEYDSLYLLENFYYYIGYNYDLLGIFDMAEHYYLKALFLLENQNKTEHIKAVQEKLESIKNKLY